MKKPLIIVIAIVAAILGFLLFYSQQHDMPTAQVEQASGAGHGAAPAAGGVSK